MAFDFFAGCLGGLAGVVVGHPFDTVKVRLQTQSHHYRGVANCFITIVHKEGFLGLFRGMASPMAGLGFINAIIFGVQGETVRRFKLTGLKGECIAGALSGAVQSIICGPMELAKTRVQVQGIDKAYKHIFFHTIGEGSSSNYYGSFDCMAKIYKTNGLKGCFRGLGITFLRDTPAFSLYFGSFYMFCNWLTPQGSSPHELSAGRLLIAGGLGGTFSWVVLYPIDVIKSKFQADGVGPKPNYNGYIDCVQKTYKSEGLHGFGRGMLATILRAFPVNAATLTVVTITLRFANTRDSQLEIA
ncbi:mitochondrial basic amino acids transporter [Exaiptasia diaphana]|uniref:Mitochondrial basic amino acids transporter n=1 Tax=Exaiptasia diaphana TaxID=2652724 RepID=A0A913Y1B3_EXADI|nr:mitochondrial basic amino acids transporter [Exaiptasia diaphana]KXJ19828.1 Mitochondrial basic amino acids transporter [Exaiptasia diaphana]